MSERRAVTLSPSPALPGDKIAPRESRNLKELATTTDRP